MTIIERLDEAKRATLDRRYFAVIQTRYREMTDLFAAQPWQRG